MQYLKDIEEYKTKVELVDFAEDIIAIVEQWVNDPETAGSLGEGWYAFHRVKQCVDRVFGRSE